MPPSKPRVLVLGHSFIARLNQAFYTGEPRLDMDLDHCHIKMVGRGGATIADLHADILQNSSVVRRFRPEVVILQIGGNDLSSISGREAGSRMMHLLDLLVGLPYIRRVVLLEVFARQKPRYISAEEYASEREELNTYLAAAASLPDRRDTVRTWDHRRLEHSPRPIFAQDGVHLSRDIGIPKYWRVVRGAIITALRSL